MALLPVVYLRNSRPVPATGTGPVLKLPALFAGRYLGWQQRGEVVHPQCRVDPARIKETLDMPCRIFHAGSMGGAGIYEIRQGFFKRSACADEFRFLTTEFVCRLPVARIIQALGAVRTPHNYIFGVVFIVCSKIRCEVSATGFHLKIFGVRYV